MIIHNRSEHIFLIFFVYLINITLFVTSTSCIAKNSCKCQYENGTGIDLSAITIDKYLVGENRNHSYYFNPCNNTKVLPASQSAKNSIECNGGTGYSLCEYDFNTTYRNLGKMEDSELNLVSDLEAYIIFNRNNTQTIVKLVCSKILDSYLYIPVIGNAMGASSDKNLILFSPKACVYQAEPPQEMSTGSVLIILFLSFVGAYLFIGILYRIFVAGASGIEVIPNLEFWRDLPSLVMDGVKFIQNGCKVDPLVQTNQDSYDAI